jgi:hypothetical protein
LPPCELTTPLLPFEAKIMHIFINFLSKPKLISICTTASETVSLQKLNSLDTFLSYTPYINLFMTDQSKYELAPATFILVPSEIKAIILISFESQCKAEILIS